MYYYLVKAIIEEINVWKIKIIICLISIEFADSAPLPVVPSDPT